jgi:thioredoxin reductase (NADPH)
MIGGVPHTDWLGDFVELDRSGYIVTGPDLHGDALRELTHRPPMLLETSVPGVFAAGDVRLGSTKRLASAVGEGAVVLRVVQDYLAQLSSRSTHAVAA